MIREATCGATRNTLTEIRSYLMHMPYNTCMCTYSSAFLTFFSEFSVAEKQLGLNEHMHSPFTGL